MKSFKSIRARAEKRKGGPAALAKLLPKKPNTRACAKLGDDRVLAEMTRRVFQAGFVWSIIEAKWPGFEAAFLGFDPVRLLAQPPEFWDRLTSDTRIVRNGARIVAVRRNAAFVRDVAKEHGSFGRMLANWPATDQVGLLALLAERGDRLGGNSGQLLLRLLGWDAFVLSRDVVACLLDAGLDISAKASSKRDLAKIQAQFNLWAEESGLPYAHLSRICAMSIGPNATPED